MRNRKAAFAIAILAVAVVWYFFFVQPTAIPKGWVSETQGEVTFSYPPQLTTTYITALDWPPKVSELGVPFSCTEGGDSEAIPAGMTRKLLVNGHTYCVTREVGAAAGSRYTMYSYIFAKEGKVYAATFSTRAPECGNYDEPQKTACEAERNSFSIDALFDHIAGTVHSTEVY
jgi:hypothetical protein